MNNWQGFALSLLTAVLWGVLPVFLQICLQVMDSSTITWYRFLAAAIVVGIWLWSRNALPQINRMGAPLKVVLLLASLALVANYVGNVEALDYINPETVQVVMQLAPLMLMLGGIVFYKERFNRLELAGAISLVVGLGLFFNQRFDLLLAEKNAFNTGVFWTIFAAVCWAAYALLQKPLLRVLTAKQLTLCIYVIGIVVLLPVSDLSDIGQLNLLQQGALLFCCLNTIVAYGAFTEAMNIWSASKVSAVIATAPIFAFLSVWAAQNLLPEYFSLSELDRVSFVGALMVILGSVLCSLGKPRGTISKQP